jgi:predicted nucleic acid-binding protein
MATGKPKFYWDTAPLIAWIIDEKRDDPAEMDGLTEVIDLVERGKAILMTSVLWRAEVLHGSLTGDQKSNLTRVFQNRYIQELSIDARVMDLAGEIRDFQRKQQSKDVMKNIRVPDAIHLASAIHYEATEFHTFDGKKADGNTKSLLTLDGNVGGHRLKICVPKITQLRLNFGSGLESKDAEDTDSSKE